MHGSQYQSYTEPRLLKLVSDISDVTVDTSGNGTWDTGNQQSQSGPLISSWYQERPACECHVTVMWCGVVIMWLSITLQEVVLSPEHDEFYREVSELWFMWGRIVLKSLFLFLSIPWCWISLFLTTYSLSPSLLPFLPLSPSLSSSLSSSLSHSLFVLSSLSLFIRTCISILVRLGSTSSHWWRATRLRARVMLKWSLLQTWRSVLISHIVNPQYACAVKDMVHFVCLCVCYSISHFWWIMHTFMSRQQFWSFYMTHADI